MNPKTPMSVALNLSQPAQATHAAPLHSYLVGEDGEGHWVAMEAKGMAGGIFRTRQDAIRYACRETGCRASEVSLAVGPLRFRLS